MAIFETVLKSDLKKPVQVKQLSGNLFSADNGGNKITVEVLDNGSPATLSGGVTGYIVRSDNAMVMVTGSLSGNRASIVLPSSAYNVVGQVSIVVKVGTTTVGACTAFVYRTTTDTLIDPGHAIPSIEELLALIGDTTAAKNAANDAASLANTKAGLADEKATLANTKAGLADEKATLADQKATAANNAASTANAAAAKINNMEVAVTGLAPGSSPTVAITETGADSHKKITFGLVKGDKGDTGDAFHIVKTYASISAMNADYSGTDVSIGEYVMIVSNVEDPDNAKVYIKGSEAYSFVVDMSGSAGIQGQAAHIYFRYAASEPTQDSDMKTTPDNWIGVYAGTASSAPTVYTSYTWSQFKGDKGDPGNNGTSSYVHIKYAAAEPTQDSDMKDTADAWIGVYSGSSASAPTTYTSYTWAKIKGETGNPGAGGASAYVHIKWAAAQPTQDSDMKSTADAWMGIYSGSSSSAPTAYTSYTWYKVKGETGSAANVYGNTVEMSSTDSTKVSEAIASKITAPSTAGTSGQVLTSDGNGGQSWQTPSGGTVTDVQEDGTSILNNGVANILTMTGAGSSSAGTKGLVPAPASGDNGKFLKGDGTWGNVPNPQVMTGATSSAAGSSGLVPAPAITDRQKFLCGDGSWAIPDGGKLVVFDLDTVTNSGGSYTHTTTLSDVTHDMKAVVIEVSNSGAFGADIEVSTADGSITLSCDEVNGTSEVTVSCVFVANANAITSSEFDVLSNRIGSLSSLATEDKSSLVSAVNELNDNKVNTSAIANNLTTTSAGYVLDARQGKALSNNISNHLVSYIDITDSTPVNVNSKTSQVVGKTNFISAVSTEDGIMCLPYINSGIMYVNLANYSDLSPVTGSHTIRIMYRT